MRKYLGIGSEGVCVCVFTVLVSDAGDNERGKAVVNRRLADTMLCDPAAGWPTASIVADRRLISHLLA